MGRFVEVKTSELSGASLDWAVAVSLGYECGLLPDGNGTFGCNTATRRQCVIGPLRVASITAELNARFFRPSTDWVDGGPLIDKFDVWLSCDDGTHCASTHPHVNECIATGPTKLIAACRAIVAAKSGDVAPVPAELVGREEKI